MSYDHPVMKTKTLVEMIGGGAGANVVVIGGPNDKPTDKWLEAVQSAEALRVPSRYRASLAAGSR